MRLNDNHRQPSHEDDLLRQLNALKPRARQRHVDDLESTLLQMQHEDNQRRQDRCKIYRKT